MLVFHGDSDDVIDYKQAISLYDKYLKPSPCFDFRLIPDLFHSVSKQELQTATKWMLSQLEQSSLKQ
jgi:predicted esterase